MSNYVFLIDANKTPMNPIHPAHARELLETGKAAVFRRYPFVLIMNRVVENIVTYPITLKIDPGSKFTGIALVNNRGDFAYCKGATGRIVVQSATRLEIRVDGKRIGGKVTDFFKFHSKDAYSYV